MSIITDIDQDRINRILSINLDKFYDLMQGLTVEGKIDLLVKLIFDDKYEEIRIKRTSLIQVLSKILVIYIEKSDELGQWIYGEDKDGYVTGPYPDKYKTLYFELKDCNELLIESESDLEKRKKIISIIQSAINI